MLNIIEQMLQISDPELIINSANGFFENPNVLVYWKDSAGKFLGANNSLANKTGLQCGAELVGATDYDFAWSPHADIMFRNDQMVRSAEEYKSWVEIVRHSDRNDYKYFSFKSPIRNQLNKSIGVFGISLKLDDNLFSNSVLSMAAQSEKVNPNTSGAAIDFSILTDRQKMCVYYLVRGMTAKDIAKILNLSPRTVEHYIEEIKLKCKCQSRADLIMQATENFIIMPVL